MVIVQKKSSGTWWKCILSFIGGFIFAFVAVAGGLAIASTQVKSGDLLGEYADTVLTVEYQEKTIFDIVMSFVNHEIDYSNLDGISKVSPLVDTYLQKLSDTLEDKIGVSLNIEETKKKPWAELPEYVFNEVKDNLQLSKVFGVTESSDNIMKSLCFEKNDDGTFNYDHPYSLGDFINDEHFIQDKIDNLTIKDVIGDSSEGASQVIKAIENKTIKQLKEEDVVGPLKVSEIIEVNDSSSTLLKAIKDKTVNELKSENAFDDLKVSDIVEVTDSSSSVLKAIKDKTVHELKNDDVFGDLLISDIVEIDDSSTQILKTFKAKGTRVNQLNDAINDLLLSEVIDINDSSPKILKTFKEKNVTVNGLGDAINDLLLSDVIEITDSSPKILKTFKERGTTVNGLSDEIDNLYLCDVFESDDPDNLPPVMKRLLGNSADPVEVTGSPLTAHIDYEKYAHVIFSNGPDKTAEGYQATGYIKIKSFYDTHDIAVVQSGESFLVNTFGTTDRSALLERIFDIEVDKPASWSNLYITLCNEPTKVKGLDSSIDELELKDVMKLDSSSPLYKVRHCPINDTDGLFDNIKATMTIKDIFGDELSTYKFINKLDENTTIDGIGDAINNMKLIDAFDDNIYDNSGNLESMWKYLLIEEGETWIAGNPNRSIDPFDGYACKTYTVNGDGVAPNPKGVNQMMTNMKYWMENQKLKTLQDDGMVNISGGLLTTEIPATIKGYDTASGSPVIPSGAVYYGDLSTKQFVELMNHVLPYIS